MATKLDVATMKSIALMVAEMLQASQAVKPQAQPAAKAAKVPLAQSKSGVDAKTDRRLKTDAAVVRAFARKGYGNVTPREDVRTYNKFLEIGLKVRPGEKSVKVGSLRLFHVSQCEHFAAPPKANVVSDSPPVQAEGPANSGVSAMCAAMSQAMPDPVQQAAIAEGLVSANSAAVKYGVEPAQDANGNPIINAKTGKPVYITKVPAGVTGIVQRPTAIEDIPLGG